MLNDEQLKLELKGVTAADAVICLQIIQRLVNLGQGAIQDNELAPVGQARNNLVKSMEEATGVNFDVARAAQQRAVAEAQRKQQEAQAKAAKEAAEAAAAQQAAETATVKAAKEQAEADAAAAAAAAAALDTVPASATEGGVPEDE